VPVVGRAGKFKNLTLGLDGTNSRFPWKPSATVLTYRLTGTTEANGVNQDEPHRCSPPKATTAATGANLRPPWCALKTALRC
jgi:hypothetical protein